MGGNGYVQKEALADELVNAVRKVLDGRKFVTPLFAEVVNAAKGPETLHHMKCYLNTDGRYSSVWPRESL